MIAAPIELSGSPAIVGNSLEGEEIGGPLLLSPGPARVTLVEIRNSLLPSTDRCKWSGGRGVRDSECKRGIALGGEEHESADTREGRRRRA